MVFAAVCAVLCLSNPAPPAFPEDRAIAAVLIAEAGGEGRAGMEAVAEVILTRSLATGKTPLEVVTRPKQFSCLNETTVDRLVEKAARHPRFAEALEIALVLAARPDDLPRRTNSADHYCRKDLVPYWARGRDPVAVIGRHAFYRLDERAALRG